MKNPFAIEAALYTAIPRGELQLFYQPIVDAQGETREMEALLRWVHPVRGLIGPDAFIPIAEQCGQILPIGLWVLETACQQLMGWATQPVTSEWKLSVNVSARQLGEAHFADSLLEMLGKTGAPPSRLCLELTETTILARLDGPLKRRINRLRAAGIGFALDNFGVGYASFAYLQQLPLDRIKIDRSFVRAMLDDSVASGIVASMVRMADALQLEIVAEGVETPAQRDALLEVGCRFFQGYLFGHPCPLEHQPLVLADLGIRR